MPPARQDTAPFTDTTSVRSGPFEPADWVGCDTREAWAAYSQPAKLQQTADTVDGWVSRLKVQGMHCSACAGMIERALLQVQGVRAVQVNVLTSRVAVVWDAKVVKPSSWLKAVSNAGYGLLPLQGFDFAEQTRRESRTMLWRWLLAGFCTMQVMMYAWPNYIAKPGDIDPLSDSLLRWASWMLTLFVLLISCKPFFAGAWQSVRHQRVTMDLPVALGMALTFAVSTVAVWDPRGQLGGELYLDSLCMLAFFLLTGRWIESRLKVQVASDIEATASQLPLVAERVDAQGVARAVPVNAVQVGDVISVRMGESFTVDGVVVRGTTTVDESLLTGESNPVVKLVGDRVVAGSVNLQAVVHVRATHVGLDTRFAQIQELMAASAQSKPAIMQLADRLAGPFLWAVLTLAACAGVFWWSQDPHRALVSAIAVLIVTCPCALALAAPAAFLSSASALARKGILTRRLDALERMAQVNAFMFDKTGTLTLADVAVVQVAMSDPGIAGHVWPAVAALTSQSLHPLSRSLNRYASEQFSLDAAVDFTGVNERVGEGIEATDTSGHTWRLGSGRFCGVPDDGSAKRVFLTGQTLAGVNGWLASFEMQEALRPDALDTLQSMRRELAVKGATFELLSGDNPGQVQAIGAKLGFAQEQSHAGLSANAKLAHLLAARQRGSIVAMVGDGVNDALVLSAADVSIAPANGSSMAMLKSDFILTNRSLQPLAQLQMHARQTLKIVKQNLAWALAYNTVFVPLAFMGWLTPWMAGIGMAVSSLVVLLNALRLRSIPN